MQMIEIKALENGAHNNQTYHGFLPDGWAFIPDEMEIPDTYPFVNLEVEGDIVVSMTAGIMLEPELEPEPTPTEEERITALEAAMLAMMEG